MPGQSPLQVETGREAVALPQRIALVHRRLPARLETRGEKQVMTFPHLGVREVIAIEILLVGLGLVSLFLDAPLESLANPNKTPNPAKAPWYFLGLQELLHYFPPVVAGVLVPILVVIALVVIPYFKVNVARERLWKEHGPAQLHTFGAGVLLITSFLAWFRVWVALIPTVLIALLMASTFLPPERGPWSWLTRRTPRTAFFAAAHDWLASRSLAGWIMTWFIALTVILTAVGTFFRGPGWSFVWPWQL